MAFMSYDPQPQSLISKIQDQVENIILYLCIYLCVILYYSKSMQYLKNFYTLLTELGECIFKNDAPPLNSNLKLFTAN